MGQLGLVKGQDTGTTNNGGFVELLVVLSVTGSDVAGEPLERVTTVVAVAGAGVVVVVDVSGKVAEVVDTVGTVVVDSTVGTVVVDSIVGTVVEATVVDSTVGTTVDEGV